MRETIKAKEPKSTGSPTASLPRDNEPRKKASDTNKNAPIPKLTMVEGRGSVETGFHLSSIYHVKNWRPNQTRDAPRTKQSKMIFSGIPCG
jgi:hypothetical protein